MKILVIQMKMIGDVLTSSILFEALRDEFPEAQLDYLVYKHTLPVIAHNPYINNFIIFEPEKDRSFKGLLKFGSNLQKKRYDVVIDVYSKPYSAFLAYKTSAAKRIGYTKWYTKLLYTHIIERSKTSRSFAGLAIENRLALLKPLSIEPENMIKPRIYLTEKEIYWAREYLKSSGVDPTKPVYMISILGSSEDKTYPKKYMVELLNYIASSSPCTLLYNYIPSQKPQVNDILKELSKEARIRSRADLFGKSLREFLALCAQCTALIGNEGGAINMSKALEVPTFAIFSPQIRKEAWANFESELNVAVHLHDYHSEKNEYKDFKPQLIIPKLQKFLNKHS